MFSQQAIAIRLRVYNAMLQPHAMLVRCFNNVQPTQSSLFITAKVLYWYITPPTAQLEFEQRYGVRAAGGEGPTLRIIARALHGHCILPASPGGLIEG